MTNTTINDGGVEIVLGAAAGTTINSGGGEVVFGHGTTDNVTFAGPDGRLELVHPSALNGTITNWQIGDVIIMRNTHVSNVHERAIR